MGDLRPSPNFLGEYYGDRLVFEAFLKKSSVSQQAITLLRTALNSRQVRTDEKLTYLARKRGLTLEEFQRDILFGQAEHLNDEEYFALFNAEE